MPRKSIPGWEQLPLPFLDSPKGVTSQPTPGAYHPPVASKPLDNQNTGPSPLSATSFKPLGFGVKGGGGIGPPTHLPTTFSKGK
jgi:hypothetical protein